MHLFCIVRKHITKSAVELHARHRNEYLAELAKLQGLRDSLSPGGVPIEVPIELLRYVDDGGNPDVFTVDAIKASVAANQISKGKAEAFRQLKDRTTQKLKEAFPEDITDYQQLRQEVVQGGGAQGPSGG